MMQAIEYLLSIGMARIGLAEWIMLNNIYGAFGAFRRSLLVRICGWDTQTAEDLVLTLRLKSYFGRHPPQRLPFEPAAIGHTDVPASFGQLLTQRLRWDGDLLFLDAHKQHSNLWPSLMGWPTFMSTMVSGLFIQVMLTFIILIDSTVLLSSHSLQQLTPILIGMYGVYLLLLSLQFLLMITLNSERPMADLHLAPFLPLFPLVMGVIRLWSAVAMLNELLLRSLEKTAMAPWWVIRRAHRF